ncbi:TPA: hypothetical protein ACQYFN_000544 [Vibrio parahaemolyticus]|uniref:hypothetical protein n=1 Tax=Vibrio parahaemolyticus TaxID=670 RepID=UPI00111DF775|nr:hypothetical protein [Vibrio parahaemolyticus]TOJ91151.1 hypothetical protein CGI30_06100 [Vibrio parahaemolyticus]HCG6276345.1 hypothetical protein [Vibrio parahaemolyticus]HCG6280106.1 hypothetical protein [Vibrio parahaemolyticus]
MSKFNPFADEVLHAVFEDKEGVVLTASTAELVQVLGGEVEAQMAEQSGIGRDEWTSSNLSEFLSGRKMILQRDSKAGEFIEEADV